ncbi:MAG: GNAT family N-acetyltransferase [Chloroflexi bacterium]|nr:GNAT family N-acetyltransferase [Chloroflexota bacterium]
MEASLWALAEPAWVEVTSRSLREDGVAIEAYQAELTLPLLQFVQQEFPGDWVRVAREAMTAILRGEPAERLFVAREGERVLGFVHHEKERFGPIGVGSGERGRGIGQALMFKALGAMRHNGFRTAWFLWSDDRTARRLYDSASFREVRRFAVLRKDLSQNRSGQG